MTTHIIEAMKAVSNYLADEESNFWENCECSDSIIDEGRVELCKCEANDRHILKDIRVIDSFLSALTPRTSKILKQIEMEKNI